MSSSLRAAIQELQAQVDQKASELTTLKRTVNMLCVNLGEQPIYSDADEPGARSRSLSAHEFYGKSPLVASRMYLEMVGEPVPAEEILDALVRGGFDFDEQGWEEKSRLRALAISLSKNTAIFHKLPNGTYGLIKWYPTKAKKLKISPVPEYEPEGDNAGEDQADDTENGEASSAEATE